MFRRVKIILLIAVFALNPLMAFAQNALTWNDCVEKASAANPDILSATSTLSSNQYKAKAAYSNFLPQISGETIWRSLGAAS